MLMDLMEEQNHSVNDSEIGNPSIIISFWYILQLFIFQCIFCFMVFMIEWRINNQTNKPVCMHYGSLWSTRVHGRVAHGL